MPSSFAQTPMNNMPQVPLNSYQGSINPSIAQTPAGYAQTPAQPGVYAPPQTLEGGQSMNQMMQNQLMNSESSNEGSHDSGKGSSSGNSQNE